MHHSCGKPDIIIMCISSLHHIPCPRRLSSENSKLYSLYMYTYSARLHNLYPSVQW